MIDEKELRIRIRNLIRDYQGDWDKGIVNYNPSTDKLSIDNCIIPFEDNDELFCSLSLKLLSRDTRQCSPPTIMKTAKAITDRIIYIVENILY